MDLRDQLQSRALEAPATNRVLRNTYWLLAASLVPTVLGAIIAMHIPFFQTMSPAMRLGIFFLGAFGLMFLVERNRNSAAGVGFLMLFTFFMGTMLSQILSVVLMSTSGAQTIGLAFGGTAIIFAAMAAFGGNAKRDLSGLGKTLLIGAIIVLVTSVAAIFMHIPAMSLTVSAMAMIVFSLYISYDINRIVRGGETNYISATLALYLNVYNVFVSLLSLIGFANRN